MAVSIQPVTLPLSCSSCLFPANFYTEILVHELRYHKEDLHLTPSDRTLVDEFFRATQVDEKCPTGSAEGLELAANLGDNGLKQLDAQKPITFQSSFESSVGKGIDESVEDRRSPEQQVPSVPGVPAEVNIEASTTEDPCAQRPSPVKSRDASCAILRELEAMYQEFSSTCSSATPKVISVTCPGDEVSRSSTPSSAEMVSMSRDVAKRRATGLDASPSILAVSKKKKKRKTSKSHPLRILHLCPVCHAPFALETALARHLRMHRCTNEQPLYSLDRHDAEGQNHQSWSAESDPVQVSDEVGNMEPPPEFFGAEVMMVEDGTDFLYQIGAEEEVSTSAYQASLNSLPAPVESSGASVVYDFSGVFQETQDEENFVVEMPVEVLLEIPEDAAAPFVLFGVEDVPDFLTEEAVYADTA